MIVDTSALIAIATGEPEAEDFVRRISAASPRRLSSASYLESGIVLDGRRNPILTRDLDALLERFDMAVEPVTVEQARIARQAYRDFGRGSGHPARLNFGDCFAYALAKDTDEELLFKGDDFIHTDVRPAVRATDTSTGE
jgi:ribonuclease VapC